MKKKKVDKKIKKEIPVEVKSLFGKFYVFSIILDLILLIFMPFALKKISRFFAILTLLMFLIIYYFMLKDFFKKRQHFFSDFIVLMMIFTFFSFSILFLKIIGLTWNFLYFLYNTWYNCLVVNEEVLGWELLKLIYQKV